MGNTWQVGYTWLPENASFEKHQVTGGRWVVWGGAAVILPHQAEPGESAESAEVTSALGSHQITAFMVRSPDPLPVPVPVPAGRLGEAPG